MAASSSSSKMPAIDLKAVINDFRNLNPNDVGAWPLIPRIVALIFLLIAILVAAWFLLWSDQITTLEGEEQKEARLKQEYLDKKKQAVNLDLYKQQLTEIDQTFGALLKQLPNKSEMEALLTEINQSGLGRGLQFDLFKPGPEQLKEFYAERSIVIKITGGYHDFGAFASDIARLPRIVTLNNIAVTPGTAGKLNLDATTKTFRYLDADEVARQKQAQKKPGAKKGANK